MSAFNLLTVSVTLTLPLFTVFPLSFNYAKSDKERWRVSGCHVTQHQY